MSRVGGCEVGNDKCGGFLSHVQAEMGTRVWLANVAMLQFSQCSAVIAEEEEQEFYKLRPANKTDHLCQ